MNVRLQRLLFWTPRILGILFASFLSLFALDVFSEGQGLGEVILPLLIHLVPVYVVVIALIVAWRWPVVGAIVFPALAVCYVFMSRVRFHWAVYVTIPVPLVILGVLFFLNWKYRVQLRVE
jgi:hypothetical protein